MPGTVGSQRADRISGTFYDSASQVLKQQTVMGAPLQRDVATYTYFLNRKRTSMTDARGYRVEMRYGGL